MQKLLLSVLLLLACNLALAATPVFENGKLAGFNGIDVYGDGVRWDATFGDIQYYLYPDDSFAALASYALYDAYEVSLFGGESELATLAMEGCNYVSDCIALTPTFFTRAIGELIQPPSCPTGIGSGISSCSDSPYNNITTSGGGWFIKQQFAADITDDEPQDYFQNENVSSSLDIFDRTYRSTSRYAYLLESLQNQARFNGSLTLVNWRLSAVSAVPEPSTYAMMIFGLLGIITYYRRQHA